jgi:hypothetical protein
METKVSNKSERSSQLKKDKASSNLNEARSEASCEAPCETEHKIGKTRVSPTTLNEARLLYSSKLLINLNKLNVASTDIHLQLVNLLLKHVLKYFFQYGTTTKFNLNKFPSAVDIHLNYDTNNISQLVKDLVESNYDENEFENIAVNLIAIVNLLNTSILNYAVYIDSKKFGKYKLFQIIETTIFTQLLCNELNPHEFNLKQSLKTDINTLKVKRSEKPVPSEQ